MQWVIPSFLFTVSTRSEQRKGTPLRKHTNKDTFRCLICICCIEIARRGLNIPQIRTKSTVCSFFAWGCAHSDSFWQQKCTIICEWQVSLAGHKWAASIQQWWGQINFPRWDHQHLFQPPHSTVHPVILTEGPVVGHLHLALQVDHSNLRKPTVH